MRHEIEVRINPYTFRVDRYPWEKLRQYGDELVFTGKEMSKQSVRQSAYMYAKRNRIKVSVIYKNQDGSVRVILL